MILIFGGAYQGKLEYAQENYKGTVYNCIGSKINFDADIINDIGQFVFSCVKEGKDAEKYISKNIERLKGKVIICNDVSQGIVPIDPLERQFRDMVGRVMVYLGREAESVIRIFCGLPQKVK